MAFSNWYETTVLHPGPANHTKNIFLKNLYITKWVLSHMTHSKNCWLLSDHNGAQNCPCKFWKLAVHAIMLVMMPHSSVPKKAEVKLIDIFRVNEMKVTFGFWDTKFSFLTSSNNVSAVSWFWILSNLETHSSKEQTNIFYYPRWHVTVLLTVAYSKLYDH